MLIRIQTDGTDIFELIRYFNKNVEVIRTHKFDRCIYQLRRARVSLGSVLDQVEEAIPIAHRKEIISGETLFLSIFDRNMVLYWAKDIGLVTKHPSPHLAAIVAYEFLALNRSVVCKKRKAKQVARDFLVETNDLVKVANELSTELSVLRSLKICNQSKLRFENAYRSSETNEKYWRNSDILTPNELLALNGDL